LERRSMLLNFVPFGAGQFQQHRNGWGWFFAVTQAVLAVTSVTSYFAYQNQVVEQQVVIDVAPGQPKVIKEIGIPASRESIANSWRLAQYITGFGFYGLYAIGAVDAVLHHRSEVLTRIETISEPRTELPRPYFFPTVGGAGAGLSFQLP
jgi:hypothetical protein